MNKNNSPGTLAMMFAILLSLVMLITSACYSVTIASKHAIPEPDDLHESQGFYQGKKIVKIKETVKLSLVDNYVVRWDSLGNRGFHSVEYRVTIGDVLLNTITLGKVRKMRVIYVPEKMQN
ncbi:MAG: hypothetical protein IPL46_01780 [Saprospiraceae bacterium]|nr:hypothetical protein [Saprospiraceae bacterium]